MSSKLKLLQADILGVLSLSDYFADITIVAEDKADLTAIINRALAPMAVKGGKGGVCVVVEEPEAEAPTTIPGPYITSARLKVVVLENVANNRGTHGTGKTCYAIAEQIQSLLFDQEFAGTTEGKLWPGAPAIQSLGPVPDNPQLVVVQCAFEAHVSLPVLSKVAEPTIGMISGDHIQLVCSTSGAAIKYSIDGSFPSMVYTAPFTAPVAGTTVRAVAAKTGSATSNVVAAMVS